MSSDVRYFRTPPWSWPARWDDHMKIAASYVQTTRHRTTEGLFQLPLEYGAADLGWTVRKFEKAMRGLIAEGIIEYDAGARVVLIVMADPHRFLLQVQSPENPNQVTAALKQLEELPPTPLLGRLHVLAERFSERLAKALTERFGERLTEGSPNGLSDGFVEPPTPSLAHARTPRGEA